MKEGVYATQIIVRDYNADGNVAHDGCYPGVCVVVFFYVVSSGCFSLDWSGQGRRFIRRCVSVS